MSQNIFRKQSLDRISSPEQLTDYMKMANPGVWVTLCAVLVLMVSVLIWSVFGSLPSTQKLTGFVRNGVAVAYADGETAAKLQAGMLARMGDYEGTVTETSEKPISLAEIENMYEDAYTAASLAAGQWNYPVGVDAAGVPDGLYEITITTDETKPFSFIFN